ncbi:hypothetical protein [Pontibacterium sp.]|uniref:hypothetical protein n=1 Tax=Pontibacterium sp. TaxID=2036026 RepID=UPI003563A757
MATNHTTGASIADVADLPFVSTSESGRNFWCVSPSGDYQKDYDAGRRFGNSFIEAARRRAITPFVLQLIIAAFPSELTPVEFGFLSQVSMGVAA